MVRLLTFGDLKIWLFIQQLHAYPKEHSQKLLQTEEFICYFKFSEPTMLVYGELICSSDNKQPMLFSTMEEAETFASEYLKQRFNLVSY